MSTVIGVGPVTCTSWDCNCATNACNLCTSDDVSLMLRLLSVVIGTKLALTVVPLTVVLSAMVISPIVALVL